MAAEISPRCQPIHTGQHIHHTYLEEIAAASHQPRDTRFNVENPHRTNQPNLLPLFARGITTSFSLNSTRGSYTSRFHYLGQQQDLGAASSSIERSHQRVMEQQIRGTTMWIWSFTTFEDESLFLPCKIFPPISFFFPLFSSPFGGFVLKYRSSPSLSLSLFP